MRYLLYALAVFLAGFTFLSLIRQGWWWARVTDFPRQHVAIAIVLTLAAWSLYIKIEWLPLLAIGLLLAALGVQIAYIVNFTPLVKVQVPRVEKPVIDNQFSILIANVRQKNKEYHKLLDLVKEVEPDMIIALETDNQWLENIKELKAIYPYHVLQPQDNTYGMLFFSRLPLANEEVLTQIRDDIPSIQATVTLRSGQKFRFFGIHPEPPSIGKGTEERDAELLLTGEKMLEQELPALIAGDLNDVAWSHTTRLFLRTTKCVDPRVGRGFYNTYNCNVPVFRYPLDHVFHTEEFSLVEMSRQKDIGSDHFPMLIKLQLHKQDVSDSPAPEGNDMEEKDKKIEKGKEKGQENSED